MVLRLPVASTTLAPSRPVISTKLTADAIQEFMTIAEDCEALHALSAQRDLETLAARAATSDQRRTLVDPKGAYSMSRSLPGEPAPSRAQGAHLHPTVDPAPGALQSREPAPAVRPAATSPGARLEDRGH